MPVVYGENTNSFLPFDQAQPGDVGPLRVHVVLVDPRNATDALAKKFNSCVAVGQEVDPCHIRNKPPCKITCLANQRITQRLIDVVQERLNWVRPFLANTFRVRTAKNGITVHPTVVEKYQ